MQTEYTRYAISAEQQEQKDVLIAVLSDMGVEGFEETEDTLFASGSTHGMQCAAIEAYLEEENFVFTVSTIPHQNWNDVWEANFQPVRVDDFVLVRAPFHAPSGDTRHEIVITPKMSFGTGHHATTFMMIQLMQGIDFAGRRVFDFGTGTGILAILAEKLGAAEILACDHDEWCIQNAGENIGLNHCSAITVLKDEKPPAAGAFDIMLANINRNLILENLSALADRLAKNGDLLISGFLREDEQDLTRASTGLNLKITSRIENNNWISLRLSKSLALE